MAISGLMETYTGWARSDRRAFEHTVLRYKVRDGLDIIAHAATDGRAGIVQLRRALSEARHWPSPGLAGFEPFDVEWMEEVARVLALFNDDELDRRDALAVFEYLEKTRGIGVLKPVNIGLYGQLSLFEGELEACRRILEAGAVREPLATALYADYVNYRRRLGGKDASESEWINAVSDAMSLKGRDGLRAVDRSWATTSFDRLGVQGPIPSVSGPLVTVIVTSYCPGPDLLTAVQSIVDQSWSDLECIVVDDASPVQFVPVLRAVEELDERVRVVRLPTNGGTYRARNVGIDAARGVFITFQDSDDWSHPLRIERQVAPLLGHGDVVATWSRCVRVDDDLYVNELGKNVLRNNESSLCFKRREVVSRVGYFDAVRKGADSEYRSRIESAFGGGVRLLSEEGTMAIIRRTTGSLSRSEFRPGWRHRSRFSYRGAYERWHSRIRDGADPYVPMDHRAGGFAAPARLVHGASTGRPGLSFDVIICADWRDDTGNDEVHAASYGEARALATAGFKVGLAQIQSLQKMSRSDTFLGESFYSLIESGCAQEVLTDDRVSVELVICHEPSWLQFLANEDITWRTGALWSIVHRFPVNLRTDTTSFLLGECSNAAERAFGVRPIWHARNSALLAQIAEISEPDVELGEIHSCVFPCAPAGIAPSHELGQPEEGVIEFGLEVHEVGMVLDSDPRLPIQFHRIAPRSRSDGTKPARLLIFQSDPAGSNMVPYGPAGFGDILDAVDVVVYSNDSLEIDSIDWIVLSAVERRIPVVLPFRYAPAFGGLAIYVDPLDVDDAVARLAPGSDERERHVQTAVRIAREEWGSRQLIQRVGASIVNRRGSQ